MASGGPSKPASAGLSFLLKPLVARKGLSPACFQASSLMDALKSSFQSSITKRSGMWGARAVAGDTGDQTRLH